MRQVRKHAVKRQGRPADVNAATGPKGNLLHVIDEVEGQKWLVDGGALLSIVPPTNAQRRAGPIGPGLCAANGTKIDCYGSVNKTLVIGNRSFTFSFTIANVRQRILGADFLSEFYLAPNHRDIYNETNPSDPTDLSTFDVLPATFAHGVKSTPITLVNEVNDPYYKLLDSFPEILTPSFTPVEVKHGVRHHIPTTGHPVQSRARKLDAEKLRVAKQEIDKLVKLGVCQRASASESEWASQHAERQRHRWFSGRMLACQFHWSSARAARVRFPADAAFLLEGESQVFKQSGIHLWMAVN